MVSCEMFKFNRSRALAGGILAMHRASTLEVVTRSLRGDYVQALGIRKPR